MWQGWRGRTRCGTACARLIGRRHVNIMTVTIAVENSFPPLWNPSLISLIEQAVHEILVRVIAPHHPLLEGVALLCYFDIPIIILFLIMLFILTGSSPPLEISNFSGLFGLVRCIEHEFSCTVESHKTLTGPPSSHHAFHRL